MSVLLVALVLTSGLHGTVTRGPTTPVCRVGVPCSAPAVGAVLVFSRTGHTPARVRAGAGGLYSIRLAPGYYTVTIGQMPRIGFGIRPNQVHVTRGKLLHASTSRSIPGSGRPDPDTTGAVWGRPRTARGTLDIGPPGPTRRMPDRPGRESLQLLRSGPGEPAGCTRECAPQLPGTHAAGDFVTTTSIDAVTGNLVVAGKRVFPVGLSDPPPLQSVAPESGRAAWAEIAAAGVTFVRNYTVWEEAAVGEQLLALGQELDAAPAHGLQLWVGLAGVDADLSRRSLLDQIVNAIKKHPGLGAWKGIDEPAHARVPPTGAVSVYRELHDLDPDHPVVIIEAPRGPSPAAGKRDTRLTVADVEPYAAACDIHGIDIYPIPAGAHAGGPPVNTDISVVGDMTRIVAEATGRNAIWTTLQIAWSGVFPPHRVVFPTLHQARFMAYDAIVSGARGLFLLRWPVQAGNERTRQGPPRLELDVLAQRSAPTPGRVDGRRPLPSTHRAADRGQGRRKRLRHRSERAPGRCRHLPDRLASGGARPRPVPSTSPACPPASATELRSPIPEGTPPGPSPPPAAVSPTQSPTALTTPASTGSRADAAARRRNPDSRTSIDSTSRAVGLATRCCVRDQEAAATNRGERSDFSR